MEMFTFNASYHEYVNSPRSGFELPNFGSSPARISGKSPIMLRFFHVPGARGGALGSDTALQAVRSRVPFRVVTLEFLIVINPTGRRMALG
jgi:hypothetical protein